MTFFGVVHGFVWVFSRVFCRIFVNSVDLRDTASMKWVRVGGSADLLLQT